MLYREDLDRMKCKCGIPACEDPVVFHSACHLEDPTWAFYFNGELKVVCSTCEQEVVSIAVARKEV